jgi:hypothetical protein
VSMTGARGGATFRAVKAGSAPQMVHGLWPEQIVAALPNLPSVLGTSAKEVVSARRASVVGLNELHGQIPTDRWVAVGVPVFWQQQVFGVMCLVLDLGVQGRVEPYVAIAQAAAATFQIHVLRRLGGAHQLLSQQMSVVLDALGRSVTARNSTEMAYFLANEVQQHLGCHQVAIGWRKHSGKAKVVAISGQSSFNKRGDTARAIGDAMAETLRQERQISLTLGPESSGASGDEAEVVAPAAPVESVDSDGPRPIDLAHQRLLDVCQTDRVLTYPLRSGEAVVGAWTFQWRKDRLPTPADERLIAVATGQIGPAIDWALRADQGVLRRVVRNGSVVIEHLLGRGHLASKLVTLGAVALLVVLVFVRIPYRVGDDCVLQATPRRYISARFDGVLMEARVRPGDVVRKGQRLAELEDWELRDELGLARAEWHEASKEADSLWAKGKLAESQLARIRADKAQAQIDLLEFKLNHVQIVAPMDGVVLSGDLERARGMPVQRGKVLFELAPLDRMTLEVSVPDADAARVHSGQSGEFSLQARPEQTFTFTVERVRPQAEIRKEKNSFVVEADVENTMGWLRPGMEGTAKISVGRKPLGWVLTHRMVDWLRMRLWW